MKGFTLVFLFISSSAWCQQTIEGKIMDQETGKPIPFASIGILGTSKGTSSNQKGEFSVVISGTFSLKVTCIGYESKIIRNREDAQVIQLKPIATQLNAVVVSDKSFNARKIVRKAFANIRDNYNDKPFSQSFFYRNYCKDDAVYGRLVEASVDVWKNQGYRTAQRFAGDNEEIRVTHIRRSIDQSTLAQGHEPLLLQNILQADLVGYQTPEKRQHVSFFADVNNLRTDFDNYTFAFKGITAYDGQDAYEISYQHKKDSVLTTSGYEPLPDVKGSLFITTSTHAIVKAEEEKREGKNVVRTSAYYRKYDEHYYPYHLIRDGRSYVSDSSVHWFHIELMSVEVTQDETQKFVGKIPDKAKLLTIPYDSLYWQQNTVLKTTPLEDDIISDLGGGRSLNQQFELYQQYEWNTNDGGQHAEEKFNWVKEYSRGKKPLYVIFWSGDFTSYLIELEYAKRLNKRYRQYITFVMISLEKDETKWKDVLSRYNFFSDGILHYRISENSSLLKEFKVKSLPLVVLLSRDGAAVDAKLPSNPLLEEDFKALLQFEK